MIKKEKINGLVFKQDIKFKVEDENGKVILSTADQEVFNQKKQAEQEAESNQPGIDISKKIELKEREAINKIATVLDEKIETDMNGNVSKLARDCGITTVSIAALRKGEGNPSLRSLVSIFTALDVELKEVFK